MNYGIYCITPEGKKFIEAFDNRAEAEKVVSKHSGVVNWNYEGVDMPLIIEEVPYSKGYMGETNVFYGFNVYHQKWVVLAYTTMYRVTGLEWDQVMNEYYGKYNHIDYLSTDIPEAVAIKILNKRYNIGA